MAVPILSRILPTYPTLLPMMSRPARLLALSISILALGPAFAAQEDDPPADPVAQEPSEDVVPPLEVPSTTEAALQIQEELDDALEGRTVAELEESLTAWLALVQQQREALKEARDAPEGSPARESATQLSTDLDVLASGAGKIVDALAAAGGVVEEARQQLASLHSDDAAVLDASTVPTTLEGALARDVEVLRSQLRPLRVEQVQEQLAQWLDFLQKTCMAVSNAEQAAMKAEDAEAVESNTERAVKLRGDRARLIERVRAVITALERKGGDVAEARAYVDSVVAVPPITGVRAAWATAVAWLTDADGGIAMALKAVKAAVILVVFWFLSRLVRRVVARATRSLRGASALLRQFMTTSAQRLTIIIGALIAFSTLGVDMSPLIAGIAAAGLVVGLALQGTLGNLASGLMIMVYRPFDVGDVVQVAGVSGKVQGMTLMTTAILTFDNQAIHVPNSKIWGDVITNVTANDTRRVDMTFGIGYDDDVGKAKAILQDIVTSHPKVLAEPPPMIRLHQLGDSSVNLIVRPWSKTQDYWDVFWEVTETVKAKFDEKGITIPFPQRDVHVYHTSLETEAAASPR